MNWLTESLTHRSAKKYMAATVAAITITIVIIIGSEIQRSNLGWSDLRAILNNYSNQDIFSIIIGWACKVTGDIVSKIRSTISKLGSATKMLRSFEFAIRRSLASPRGYDFILTPRIIIPKSS